MSTTDTVEILARRGNCYFPLFTVDMTKLAEQGYMPEFIFRAPGQISQLNVYPTASGVLTPQDEIPEQAPNVYCAGNPDLGKAKPIESVTVFFATGQSNGKSAIASLLGQSGDA